MASDSEPAESSQSVDNKEVINKESVALMTRIAEGDTDAFADLVGLHQHAVIGTCAKMTGSIDDAHDLAQQVFLRVWKSAPRYQPTARFTTWLFTITRNLVFNHTRSNQRATLVSIDADPDNDAAKLLNKAAARTVAPDDATLNTELAYAIDAAIQQLPENQRLAVILRRYEDLSYEEVAEVMETSASAIKSLLFRARSQLRQALQGYLDCDR